MSTLSVAHVRRAALAAAPVLGGLGCLVGSLADPAPAARATELVAVYSEHWDAIQLKSSAYHYGYMFIVATALGLASLVRRGRGVGFALAAGALAVLGICTLPGMLIADFYASAGGQQIGAEAMRELEVASQGGWGAAAIVMPGMLGFILSLPLAAIAVARAGLMRWSAVAIMLAAIGSFMAFAATPFGNGLMTAFFALLAVAILRIPLHAFGSREVQRDVAVDERDASETIEVQERPVAIA